MTENGRDISYYAERKTLKGRSRLLSLRKLSFEEEEEKEFNPFTEGAGGHENNVIKCIFVAGLYFDQVNGSQVPFTREQYPEEVN